jgi:hypothetical protein
MDFASVGNLPKELDWYGSTHEILITADFPRYGIETTFGEPANEGIGGFILVEFNVDFGFACFGLEIRAYLEPWVPQPIPGYHISCAQGRSGWDVHSNEIRVVMVVFE